MEMSSNYGNVMLLYGVHLFSGSATKCKVIRNTMTGLHNYDFSFEWGSNELSTAVADLNNEHSVDSVRSDCWIYAV